MKWFFVFILCSSAALAVEVGDRLADVIAEKGQPKSQSAAGKNRILNYADGSVHLRSDVVISVQSTKRTSNKNDPAPPPALRAADEPKEKGHRAAPNGARLDRQEIIALRNKQLTAINRVKSIVNQPVKTVRRTDAMKVSVMQPGWFRDDAAIPDFSKVDVRTTQQRMYDKFEYVTSNLNPGVAFIGRDLEFNPMTSYFYVDRTLPKKKLSNSEMQEINRLYRVIGECEDQLKNADEF